MKRPRQHYLLGVLAFFALCFYSLSNFQPVPLATDDARPAPVVAPAGAGRIEQKKPPQTPVPSSDGSHPIQQLIAKEEGALQEMRARQSKDLAEAVAEYRRRYGIPPPPRFDEWFRFAQSRNVELIDEFDTIHELLTPFWGLRPSTIRHRAREALGYKNALLGVQIRDGMLTNIEGGLEWQRNATQGMLASFMEFLPDMDICFNAHDEPRVIVPYEDMTRLFERAKSVNMPAASAQRKLKNSFTSPVQGLSAGMEFEEIKRSRFTVYNHQPTWTHARAACPPDSPARVLEEEEREDDVSKYALGELGFVFNETAMTDICSTPSLNEKHGFFDRSNAFSLVHDLFPIFSESKLSAFADLLYPSPWYWYEKVPYNETRDMDWSEKQDALYWRGSTTGGYSSNGGWRRHHRQRFVEAMNARDGEATVLANRGGEGDGDGRYPDFRPERVSRADYRDLVDVHFSHVGQCNPGDCAAQREFFDVQPADDQQDAWGYKHLLDMDGNAFSGRFYAFLRSRSLVFKLALFREWHAERLRPWAHYVPLSIQGGEWLEAVRFLGRDAVGRPVAEKMAERGREWTGKALRREDMEVWFFRMLLEYGRVIDDNRDQTGFSI